MIYQFDLTELEFRLIQDLIQERFGIYLKDEKRSFIKMRLYPRAVTLGFESFREYFQFIKYGPENERELLRMISLLTNTETYFFREVPQLNAFRDYLLPEFREKKIARNEKRIRILSAGCSTGEEVYTLAMLTFDTGNFFWGWDVQIIGIDINEMALETARQGIYYERSFRMTDPEYREKFFSSNSGDFITKENIKRMTSFVFGNITLPLSMRDFDLIFCRNVLIYFSEEKFKSAIHNFCNVLRPGGYLLLGHSETLTGMSDEFEIRRFPETFVYKKKEYSI
ncbi:MAG: CheR family methyltransferase [bacterium]